MSILLLVLAASMAVADPYAAWRQKEEAAWRAALAGPCGNPMRQALAAEGRVGRAALEMHSLFLACFDPRTGPCDWTREHDAKHRCREQAKVACTAEPSVAAAESKRARLFEESERLKSAYQRCSGTSLPEPLCPAQYEDPSVRCAAPQK